MRIDIQKEIVEPLEMYLNGYITEKEIDWWNWKNAVYNARKEDFRAVRDALTPYYRKFFMANKDFFRNGNTDTQVKNALLDMIEREGNYAGRLFNDLDIIESAENWAERLIVDNHEPRYFFLLLQKILTRDFKPNWKEVFEKLKAKLAKAQHSGNFKQSEMYCLLMGITLIELTNFSREKKNELLGQLKLNWGFMKYMYSVLIHYIVGMRVDNFAAMANTACNLKSSHKYLHLFYKAFKTRCDTLCPKEIIDFHSGESVKTQAERHLVKMEQIIKSTPQSDELNELCNILFPKVMEDVLKQSRPKTYEELEADIDDLTKRYNKVLEQLTNAVKDVESDKISADDLTAAFLRFPTQLALTFFGSVSTLLAMNTTWQKYAPIIQGQILAKQDKDRILVEGDYVVEKRVENEVRHVEAGGTGICVEKAGKDK